MGVNVLRKKREMDIVFCIDATSSMGPCIENIKANAKEFYSDLYEKMEKEYNSQIDMLRVKVIVFRDYECDSEPMKESEFFELPADKAEFESFLATIQPMGGGDPKESGLEALYLAMNTDWQAIKSDDRQVIVLFSDNDAIGFGEKSGRAGYPAKFTQQDFINAWMCEKQPQSFKLRPRCKRMILFAPAGTRYQHYQGSLLKSVFVPTQMNAGLKEMSFEQIVEYIAASLAAVG